jgi:molybdopterin/thiamine biosynthesis adenylyltransferase
MSLNARQKQRYARNIALAQVGEAGQAQLSRSRVLVVGAGGLGSPAALYLAAAGIGTLGLVDDDTVDISNLQRQILYRAADVQKLKVHQAKAALQAFEPDLHVEMHAERLTPANALDIIGRYDFIVDATDTFRSKYLIADACHFARKPYSHAAVLGFDGQAMTVIPGQTTCFRCVFGGPPPPGAVPSSAEVGVLGALPGVMGTLQATEAVKYCLRIGSLLTDRLLRYDALAMKFREVRVQKNVDCPLCGAHPSVTGLGDADAPA